MAKPAAKPPASSLTPRTLDELTIEDERSFRHVALYADLKEVLRRARYPFRILPATPAQRWDRALLLNLTYWGASDGGDILVEDCIAADVVAHVAWHHLAARALAGSRPGSADARPTPEALFLGEAIASAFDVYLVGRLLGQAPRSSFLKTQVPAMSEAASAAGLSAEEFALLLQSIADEPERAFEDLRQLLTDATAALFRCADAASALRVLGELESHRFAPLLHRYELSNWVLYARAHAAPESDPGRAREIDRALRRAPVSLDWLTDAWVAPALA